MCIRDRLVEPPNIIELKVKGLLPEYTGVDEIEYTGNGPHAILAGSKLKVDIKTNKPLAKAALKLGDEVFAMTQSGDDQTFSLTIPSGEGELAGGEYEFDLVDPEGIPGSRRSKFKVAIKEDEPPRVRATLYLSLIHI